MDKILLFFAENKDALTAIGIILTFLVSATSLYFSIRNNKAVHYVNSVTKNRIEWIEKLRNMVAEYASLINIEQNNFYNFKDEEGSEKVGRSIAYVREMSAKIRLMLNPLDCYDKKIIKIIEKLEQEFCIYYDKAFQCETDEENCISETKEMLEIKEESHDDILELFRLVHIYLKSEWNRVKYESQGKIYEKATQEFDIWELEQKYEKLDYRNDVWKRSCIDLKAKCRRIKDSAGFAWIIFFSTIIVSIICIIA